MSLNIKENGALRRIAGSTVILDATAAEIREGTWTNTEIDTATGDTRIEANVTFDVPMPDTDYMVIFDKPVTGHGESYNYVNASTKTTTGFTFFVMYTGNLSHISLGLQVHWYAVRLVKLEDYTELQNKVNNPDSTPTKDSTNLVTSGGVYDAIKNASSVFIGTSSEWESETSKTDYQVAILTDKPNVNAVDSTDGSTTIVGEPNKRWVGTQAEWSNLTTAEKAKYEVVCFNDDNGASVKDIYSTEEVKTNKVWIDGKPIYRKVLVAIRNGAWTPNWVLTPEEKRYNNPTDIPNNIDTLVDARAQSLRNTGWYDSITQVQDIGLSINISTQTMWANWPEVVSKADVIIEYTKTTD